MTVRRNDSTELMDEASVDWYFSGFGKLWCYNLNYFDFLNQQGMTKAEGLQLIHDFIDQLNDNPYHPTPYSLLLTP